MGVGARAVLSVIVDGLDGVLTGQFNGDFTNDFGGGEAIG
jgi:hypothetical protein